MLKTVNCCLVCISIIYTHLSHSRPVSTLANTSPTSHPSPHSTTVTPVTSDTITPTAGTSVVTAATTSPAVPVALKRSELQGSLNSIPEEVEEGEEEGEETEERRDAAVGRKPVKRLYRKDTLTRLKGENLHHLDSGLTCVALLLLNHPVSLSLFTYSQACVY